MCAGCHRGTPAQIILARVSEGEPFFRHKLRVLEKGSLVGLDYRGSMNADEYSVFMAKHGPARKE